ncbi:MAG: hypothetical protein IPP55_02020 [Anaerolineales bacterium]|nr:hypothetical protein [Anaerolineales bacterium]
MLIVANPTFGSDWSTNGVQIYADDNGDIGGNDAKRSDTNYTGDGYEKPCLIVERSKPDLGWVRFVNGETPSIQIAFNKVIFPSTPTFMWSVWASATPFDTTKFNLHDTTTEESAGSPDKQTVCTRSKTLLVLTTPAASQWVLSQLAPSPWAAP